MAGNVISWAGRKGGAGKSTLAIATTAELHRRGHNTLLVDLDPQRSSVTWGDIVEENATDDDYPPVVLMREDLKIRLPEIQQHFDYVVLDAPGRSDSLQDTAFVIADLALIPTTPDATDVWAVTESVELFHKAKRRNPALDGALVLNKIRAATKEAEHARETFSPTGLPILETEIGHRVAFTRFSNAGKGVVEYAGKSSKAGQEIISLVDEILGRLS